MEYSKFALKYVGVKQYSKIHKKIIDTYNTIKPLPRGYRVKYSDNWCATFVSFVLFSCGCKRKIFECSANRMRIKMKKYITVKNAEGQINDVVFYDWDNNGWCDHVGIICDVTKNTYKIVEGNKDKKVGVRTIKKNSQDIYAIAHIN